MHDILVLVNKSAHARLRPLVFVPDHVESVTAVCIYTAGNYEFVESVLLNGVDFSIYVKFDLQLECLRCGGDP